MVLNRSVVEERVGISMPWVDVHSAIYETCAVEWCCIGLWLIRGEGWGQSVMGIYAFCYI